MKMKYCEYCKRITRHHSDGGCIRCAYVLIQEETGLSFSQIKYESMALIEPHVKRKR